MRAILKCMYLKCMYAATAVAVVAFGADRAAAQAWGPAVAVKDIDPAIRAAAEVLGIVRTRALVIGQVNLPEYVGKGTIVDLEATGVARPVEVSRYSFCDRAALAGEPARLRRSANSTHDPCCEGQSGLE